MGLHFINSSYCCITLEKRYNLRNAGVPLRVIREISGDKNLSSLQRYLEVQPEQLVKAIGLLKLGDRVQKFPIL